MVKEIVAGKLRYNDDGNYEVVDGNQVFMLTDLLNYIYYAENNYVSLRITNSDKLLFQEDSNIYRKVNQYGVYTYYITGADLETVLFDNTEKEITVEVAAEAVEDYERFYYQK